MANKVVMLSWDAVVAVGQTILHEGRPALVLTSSIPSDCIVLFIKIEEWPSIERQAERKE